ncbi:MAG: ABC-type Na+ efflux pump permease subunit [Cellvibrionaceae bacterium]|jgi:ABC-type Na+ efflux pump permease subunit
MKPKNSGIDANLQKHILVGAGLGLYFGLFFRPAREPSLWIALGLSILITVVMFLLKVFRKDRPPVLVLLKEAPFTFLQYLLILAVFEGRHLAYDFGGRTATTVLTTIMGAITGVLIYWKGDNK